MIRSFQAKYQTKCEMLEESNCKIISLEKKLNFREENIN
jgi:hypothetical protein